MNGRLRVLVYHAISDVDPGNTLRRWTVPPAQLVRQLDSLLAHGYHFIGPEEFAGFLGGTAILPRRAVLVTFDDCYRDLIDVAPAVQRRCPGALAFAVSGLVGDTNIWDQHLGNEPMHLLDADGLRQLANHGIEVGTHSRNHLTLTEHSDEAVSDEIRGSLDDLERLGLPRPRFAAYPYGEHDLRVRNIAAAMEIVGAFTIDPGVATFRTDPMRIPRVAVLNGDRGLRFLAKVAGARQLGWVHCGRRRVARVVRRTWAARWMPA